MFLTQELPDSVCLPLTGDGVSNACLEDFLNYLKEDVEKQKGHFFAYVWGGDRSDEADTYTLNGWQVLHPNDGTYEAIVILYYSPINERATLAKWMPQFLED